MTSEPAPSAENAKHEREERARRVVAAALSDQTFMQGVREGLESERRGEGTPFKELKRKRAGR